MNITVVGVGKLGLCLSLNLENSGFNIIGVDIDKSYIKSLNNKTFTSSEKGVTDLLCKSKNIHFTTDLKSSLENDIIFVVLKTPSLPDWRYDHQQIEDLASKLIEFGPQKRRKDIIINSTTFPGYCESLSNKLIDYNYFVSYNPEFIAQGTILQDQLNADLVLIGQSDNYAGNLIELIYRKMCTSNPYVSKMTRTEAEITKLSINCFLTTKISYANMINDISVRYGCDSNVILNAVGNDSRIGSKYLKPGFGFGGPCFPRDNRALVKCGEDVGIDAVIAKATDEMNEKHLSYQIDQFIKNNDSSKEVQIEYVTYKKESVLIEESQQLKFALELKKLGYKIKILDDREEVKQQLKNII